jgi:hypothetical protein
LTVSSNEPRSPVAGSGPRASGPVRLVVGLAVTGALAFGLTQASRLPGALGETVRGNLAADREATALFYTEVDGWDDWRARSASSGHRSR